MRTDEAGLDSLINRPPLKDNSLQSDVIALPKWPENEVEEYQNDTRCPKRDSSNTNFYTQETSAFAKAFSVIQEGGKQNLSSVQKTLFQ